MTGAVFSMILADTARSQAYAQTFARRGLRARSVAVVTSPDRHRYGQMPGRPDDFGSTQVNGVWLPDLSIPLMRTLEEISDDVSVIPAGSLNTDACVDWRRTDEAGVCVFSGFGGEIVRSPMLVAGPALLHAHSGLLPEYRGSTTVYYSLLNGDGCGVSVIILDEDIDTGPVVARQSYPPPSEGVDLDYGFDPAIRADLLADVVGDWLAAGGQFEEMAHQPDRGTTYYIVHPLLKALALERLADPSARPTR